MGLGFNEPLVTAQVDGPVLTAAAAATCLAQQSKKTIPANYFDVIGKQLLIRATGRISSLITTPGTARFDIRLGGTVVFDSLAILLDTVAGHSAVGWWLEILLTARVVGSVASLFGQGKWTCEDILGVPATAPKGCLTAILPWNSAPAVGGTFDSSVAQQIDMFYTQVAATGSLTVHQFNVTGEN